MTSYQTTSSLTRTRSMRTLAKPNLTAPQATTAPVNKPAQIPTCTSNVLLFLTNSRLLDLDANPDWPDITPTTFSAKDAAGGQKKRIQCVEWALYQLFCLWDYNDAQNVCYIKSSSFGVRLNCLANWVTETSPFLPSRRPGSIDQSASCSSTKPRSG